MVINMGISMVINMGISMVINMGISMVYLWLIVINSGLMDITIWSFNIAMERSTIFNR